MKKYEYFFLITLIMNMVIEFFLLILADEKYNLLKFVLAFISIISLLMLIFIYKRYIAKK